MDMNHLLLQWVNVFKLGLEEHEKDAEESEVICGYLDKKMGFLANELRDRLARLAVYQSRQKRDALVSITKDKSLELSIRVKAQLQLQQLSRYTSHSMLVPRCTDGGRTRNIVMKKSPIEFRNQIVKGLIPGLKPVQD